MTKNQQKQFVRLWIGSTLFHADFGFDYTDVDVTKIEVLEKFKLIESIKYLKGEPAFTSTDEVFKHVIKKYK